MDVNKATTSLIANKSRTHQAQKKIRKNSLDLAFTLAKEALEAQLEEGDKLDSKADSMLVSATALLGAALVLEAVLIPLNNNSLIFRIVQVALLFPFLAVHIVVVTSASRAYEISNYQGITHPKALIAKYLNIPERVTKIELLKVIKHAYEENEKIIDNKVKLIRRAHLWRTYEAAILVVVLLTQVFSVVFVHSTM